MAVKQRRLTIEDRKRIESLLKEGHSPIKISQIMERSRRTILYEINRNGTRDMLYQDYNADDAHKMRWLRRSVAPAEKVYTEVMNLKERIIAIEENLKLMIELLKKGRGQ